MKVYMCTDLEGVSGVTSFDQECDPSGKYYEWAKGLLTAEVNAAVEAMVAAGVEDILVLDGHGPGAIAFDRLHPSAKLLHGRPITIQDMFDRKMGQYDTAMLVGQHAMAGTPDGTLNHTQNSKTVEYYKLNGRAIGETTQFALCAGAMGLPTIFLSGDAAACREAEEQIPGITTVAVKEGLTRSVAISLPPPEAHRRIRDGVAKAIALHRQSPRKPLVWPGPYVLEKKFFHSNCADGYAKHPLATRIDPLTVQLRSEKIVDIIYA